ncbi:MAG: MG2 domain-containing protein, partial [Terasakiella sp.]|nr:MG2 domain-containing protein [Terasakiella sp.]
MNRLLAATLSLIAIIMTAHSQKLPTEPDFAFPQTVITAAEKVYKTSTGLPRMQAAMQIAVARAAVNPDSAYTAPAFIAATAATEKDPAVAALLRLYEARLLAGIYSDNSWQYNRVRTPLTPLPADVKLWSGEQFKARIRELTDSALAELRPWYARPVSRYAAVVKADDAQRRLYPSLLDFAAAAAQTNLSLAGLPSAAPARLAMDATPAGSLRRAVWLVKTEPGMDALIKAYEADPRGDGAAFLLFNLSYGESSRTVDTLRAFLKTYTGELAPMLRGRLAELTQPTVQLNTPQIAVPGREIKVVAAHKYTGSIGMVVYRRTLSMSGQNEKLTKVSTVSLPTDSMREGTDTLRVTLDKPGYYSMMPVVNGRKDRSRYNRMDVLVTDYAPFVVEGSGDYAAVVADIVSGAPVAGAQVGYIERRSGNRHSLGKTGRDGDIRFKMPKSDRWRSYPLTVGVDGREMVFTDVTVSSSSAGRVGQEEEYYSGNVYLDRPIYRPGQRVEWSATLVKIDPKTGSTSLAAGVEVTVEMSDANYSEVAEIDSVTDSYGRVSGSFEIPADRLTGAYSIEVSAHGIAHGSATTRFMVSDYKAPVFEVRELVADRRPDGSVDITGRAVTYTGMPVADAAVRVSVERQVRWWRRWIESDLDFSKEPFEGVTDAEGRFTVKVGASFLNPDFDYRASVEVTSIAAEVAMAATYFTTGKPYSIAMREPGDKLCSDSPVVLPIYAFAGDGTRVKLPVEWRLAADTDTVTGRSELTPDGLALDIDNIAPGYYKLSIVPADTAMCAPLDIDRTLTLYSLRRDALPADAALLLPRTDFECAPGASAEVTVGVGRGCYVYAVDAGEHGLGRVYKYHLDAGFHKLSLPMPAGAAKAKYTLMTVLDGRCAYAEVELKASDPASLTIEAETMRDRLTPGAGESWRLRVRRSDGRAVDATMLATMYNHALDALCGLDWVTALPRINSYVSSRLYMLMPYATSAGFALPLRGIRPALDTEYPQFRYLPEMSVRYLTGGVMLKSRAMATNAGAAPAPEAVEESADEMETDDFSEIDEMTGARSAQLQDNPIAVAYGTARRRQPADADAPALRGGFMAQAFWMPDIKVEPDGSAVINFRVPEAIATWRFKALAWDTDLRTASIERDIVASKPLMAQANTPRFVRDGDRVQIISTVYNNTDSALVADTRVEFFDPATGAVLTDAVCSTDSIAAGGTARVAAWIDVPQAVSMIGYRVVSRSGAYSDGEQVPVPVLSSGATVVDTENFVLTDAEPVFETRIPGGQSVAALQYCQNPVWDVVRSLPDLLAGGSVTSSPGAVQMLYGALTAHGLRDRYAELRRVIDAWASNPADSALVSDLARNEDLKLALLAQTPWVRAAASNAERMARLTSVFDARSIKTTTDKALAALKRLRSADGGFRWGSWSDDASLWATMEVAWGIGLLRMQGDAPDGSDVYKMALDALRYCDSKIYKSDTGYAVLLAFYPGYRPTTVRAREAVNRGVQQMLKDWRGASTATKARYALALNAHGYKSVAAEVMESVRQHEVTDRNGCITFPSVSSVYDYAFILRAFAKISPRAAELDGIRRGLVMRTSVSDDLGTSCPAPLIAAILATGSRWTSLDSADAATITVDGAPLSIDAVQ